ncbi:MAG: Fic family protein [Rikenellaceae bacterium]
MDYISVKEAAARWNISERTLRHYCTTGRIEGAFLVGKSWNIPAIATAPRKSERVRETPLLKALKEQKAMKLKGSIYHRTQIDLTYNSNHIEGSRLTKDQTRYIFETNTIGITDSAVRVDDIIETTNHFRAIDYCIDNAHTKLSENVIFQLHTILKSGTSDSVKEWFVVGGYKRLPNEVGGVETTPPEEVATEMRSLIKEYNSLKTKTLDDIIDFHHRFECIHPFQDGNGRVGRLIMFKECLSSGIVPFIIDENLKMFYYRGLQNWGAVREYLRDTCLTAQDNYKGLLNYFKIEF